MLSARNSRLERQRRKVLSGVYKGVKYTTNREIEKQFAKFT